MLYLIIGLLCLVSGGFAGYKLGYDDAEEEFCAGWMTEEDMELSGYSTRPV